MENKELIEEGVEVSETAETEDAMTEEVAKARSLPTPMMLFMRILVGAYLVYTSYEVYKGSLTDGNPGMFFIVCAVLFAIAGAGVVILGLKDLIKGKYRGGPLDI